MSATTRHRFLASFLTAILGLSAGAAPAAAYELWLMGIYCGSEAQHSIGSDSDETFVVITIFDNQTGQLLAGPSPLPLDQDGNPTQWTDVDAGEIRNWTHRQWSGNARDLYIDVQVWEYDNHLGNALHAIFDISAGLGIGILTANPIAGLAAGAAANEVGKAIFNKLESADHDYLGNNAIVIDGADMAAWATHSHYWVESGSQRIDYDFSTETAGRGAKYEVYFDIY